MTFISLAPRGGRIFDMMAVPFHQIARIAPRSEVRKTCHAPKGMGKAGRHNSDEVMTDVRLANLSKAQREIGLMQSSSDR